MGKSLSLAGLFNASVLNSLWYILTGKRYERDDPEFKEALNLLIDNVKKTQLTTPALFCPWPAKNNLIRPGAWAQAMKMRIKIRSLINKQVDKHFETYDESFMRDFIDSYIQQMQKSEPNSSFQSQEGKFNLIIVLLDLFIAGAETTSSTLLWAMLYLTQNPEVQRKVHAEIDSVIGRDRPPCRDDKPRMLYVEAVLNEVHRMCSLLPMSVYHSMLEDTEFEGFLLPKGSVVFFNIFDAHHDVDYWKDPDVFRPERFLDPTGTKIVKHDALMPFGAGQRQCLGERLARDQLFIFFTGMLQAFRVEIDPGMKKVDLKGTTTFVSNPQPFKVILSER